MKSMGFEVFDAGKASLRQQAETFASAELIVGIHGSAMTNLVFCRRGTRVVEMFGWRYVNPCYRILSANVGARHYAVMDPIPDRQPPVTSFEFSSAGVDGNVEGLREMLEIMGETGSLFSP